MRLFCTRISTSPKNRDATLAQVAAAGHIVIVDVSIGLNEYGRLCTRCCIVEDAPSAQPDLLAEVDARILTLEYENLIPKEGLA